jgi:hypothetical protein
LDPSIAFENDTRRLKPDEWMSTPRGSVHRFSDPAAETVRALVMLTPDISEQFFRDAGPWPTRAPRVANG